MPKYLVTLMHGSLPGLGPTGWQASVGAADEAAAIRAAREKCRADFSEETAERGRASVVEIFSWRVTLRGKRDRRQREAFIVSAVDEGRARAAVGRLPGVYAFAGHVPGPTVAARKPETDPVVRIERLP